MIFPAGRRKAREIHHVRNGEKLSSIAQRYNCSIDDIRQWNNLRSGKLVAGQKLTVYVSKKKKTDSKLSALTVKGKINSTIVNNRFESKAGTTSRSKNGNSTRYATGKNLKTIYHVVQPGDTLWKIAQRYEGVTVKQIRDFNGLQSDNLRVGSRIKVPVTA